MPDTNLDAVVTIEALVTYLSVCDLWVPRDPLAQQYEDTYAFGFGNNKATRMWADSRRLKGTSEDLDLWGALEDAWGNTLKFTSIKVLSIKNTATTTGFNLYVGGAAANAWASMFGTDADALKIPPSSSFTISNPLAGYAVTGGTADLLKIDANGNDITYEIVVIGIHSTTTTSSTTSTTSTTTSP
jgi:hypothetical protein